MIRWHSILGYSVIGYSVVGYFPMLGIPHSYRWHSTVGYSVVGHSIVGYSGHFARNTQRPKYPTFLLGILVVGYSRWWVFRTVTVCFYCCLYSFVKVNLIKYFISNVLNKRVLCPNFGGCFGEGVLVEGVLSEGVLGVYNTTYIINI